MNGWVVVRQRDGRPVDPVLLDRLAAPLARHRPTQVTRWHQGPVGMVHAFTDTRDGSTAGPWHRGGLVLAGDVRLDDREALRARLADGGHPTPGVEEDEQLVLAALLAWGGAGGVARLRGDFAFACWDAATGALVCARDGVGVRPLFHARAGGDFVCGGSLDVVRAHPDVPATLDEAAVVSFLRWSFNVDVATTTFAAVRRLPPAQGFVVGADARAGTAWTHWTWPVPPPLRFRDPRDYAAGYVERLEAACRDRLRTPRLSISLSGGLDSTTLAAVARRVAPACRIVGVTSTATWLFDDREGEVAGAAARHLGIEHEVDDEPYTPLDFLDTPLMASPEPSPDPVGAATDRFQGRLASHATVCWQGEDGDMLLKPPGLATMLRTLPVGETLGAIAAYRWRHGRLPYLGLWWRRRLRGQRIDNEFPPVPPWVRSEVLTRTGPQEFVEPPRHPTRTQSARWLRGAFWQQSHELDAPAHTGHAMEMRLPLLDVRLLEYVYAIPPVPWCQGKALVREAFRGVLPDAVLHRVKTPFNADPDALWHRWAGADGRPLPALGAVAGSFVDAEALGHALFRGESRYRQLAWRALLLDAWARAKQL